MLAMAAAMVTVIASGCVSAWLLSVRIEERATARSFQQASPGAPAALERAALFDETRSGDQIYVYWWRVLEPTAQIPGVPPNPPIGAWFVSPALGERMSDDPALAARYRDAGVIGRVGVSHRGELLAYRFVDHELARAERLSRQPGTDWIGDGAEVVELFPIAMAALALIGIPGLGLLLAAMAPFAPHLERRQSVLAALGASAGVQRRVVLGHAALCAAPGTAVAAVGWYVVSTRLTAVPLVGRRVFAEDLGLPAISAAMVALAVILLTMAVAVVRPRSVAGNQPASTAPHPPTALRTLPLVVGIAVMVLGAIVPERAGAKVFLIGVVASAVGAVVGLPYLINRVGARLAQRPGILALLLGRRLCWNSVSSARSLLAVGALAALLPLVAAWVAVARSVDRPSPTNAYAVELRGSITDGEEEELLARTGALPLRVATQDVPNGGPPAVHLVGDCESLVTLVSFARCDATGFELARSTSILPGGVERLPGLRAQPVGSQVQSTLFVSTDGPGVEDALRSFVVNGTRTGLQVTTPGRGVFQESPLVWWILGAAALAGIVGGCALLLHLAGQAARTALSRTRLLAIGTDIVVLRRLAGGEAALAVALVGLGCTAVGALSSWMFVQKDATAAVPFRTIGYVIAGTLLAAALTGLAASGSIRGEPSLRSRLDGVD